MTTWVREDDDDTVLGDWSFTLVRGRGQSRNPSRLVEDLRASQKRNFKGNMPDKDDRVVWKKVVREEFKIILVFRKEDENVNLSPMALSRELRKKIGEAEIPKVLRDRNLFIKCKNEEQRNKALCLENICKKVMCERITLHGNVSRSDNWNDLEKNKCGLQGGEVRRLKRLIKTVNGERQESVSVSGVSGLVIPDKVKIGWICFSFRLYVPPPLWYYKCQRYSHIPMVCKGKQRCASAVVIIGLRIWMRPAQCDIWGL